VNFGQIVRPGPTRQSVEFTYIVAAATLIMPSAAFRWPGVMMIMAPTPMKTEFPEAGTLVQGRPAGPPAVVAFGVLRCSKYGSNVDLHSLSPGMELKIRWQARQREYRRE
jgi:hypothetical protein